MIPPPHLPFSTNTLWYKCNAFSTLIKVLSCNFGHNFCSLSCGSEASMNFLFPLHNFTERRDSFLPEILATSAYNFFLSLLSGALSPFRLKEALFHFSLAYLNCQHHYSGALGILLNKVRATWIPPLRSRDTWSGNQCGCWLMAGGDTWDKGVIQVLGGTELDSVRVHHATQNGGQCKTLELFIPGIVHLLLLDSGGV